MPNSHYTTIGASPAYSYNATQEFVDYSHKDGQTMIHNHYSYAPTKYSEKTLSNGKIVKYPTGWYPTSRPLKLWRKQYTNNLSKKIPINGTYLDKNGYEHQHTIYVPKPSVGKIPINQVHLPGGNIYNAQSSLHQPHDCSTCGVKIMNINLNPNLPIKNSDTYQCCKKNNTVSNTLAKVRGGTTNGTKVANMNQSYYSDTKDYLQSRCESFSKKQMTPQAVYSKHCYNDAKGNKICIPEYGRYKSGCAACKERKTCCSSIEYCYKDKNNKEQEYCVLEKDYNKLLNTLSLDEIKKVYKKNKILEPKNCCTNCGKCSEESCCCTDNIYKPINRAFSQNTAVSSNLRTVKLHYDAVISASNGLKDPWGPEIVNDATYYGNPETPYTVKSKYSPKVNFHRNGNHTVGCNDLKYLLHDTTSKDKLENTWNKLKMQMA